MTYGVDVLAFGPHPDDVEIFCGGVMIRLAELGYSTGIVDLSRGELATRGTVLERAQEAAAASEILGVRFRDNLGLPDGFLANGANIDPAQVKDSQLARVVLALRRHRPELVMAPWIEERHPDHAASGELITRAVFYAGLAKFETEPASERFVPRQLLYYAMRYRMTPSFIVDTSSAWDQKLRAMRCYTSQVTPRPDAPPTLIGSPQALAAIEARDRYYGSMIGTSYGEALRSANTLGITDPVVHFRQNSFGPAHAFEALR